MSYITYDTKGSDLMDCMLLQQYHNSPNLKAYIKSYVSELDILFTQMQHVELGRHLDCAVGKQLDVIGEILQRNRNIIVSEDYFGFVGAPGAQSFGDKNIATTGGKFKGIENQGFNITPLSDNLYRKLLKARAYVMGVTNSNMNDGEYHLNNNTLNVDTLYKSVNILFFGNYDNYLTNGLITNYSEVNGDLELSINAAVATQDVIDLGGSLFQWVTPLTRKLNITLVTI